MDMLSPTFLSFLLGTVLLLRAVPRGLVRVQNLLILAAGLVFYAYLDPASLLFLLASSLLNHHAALWIHRSASERRKRILLWASISWNLSALAFFKYSDLLAGTARLFSGLFADAILPRAIDLAIPLGISYYTFQVIGYHIDVANEEVDANEDLPAFLCYVFYFPKLFAGPIERLQAFLPQIQAPRTLDPASFRDGIRQILWGAFKKMVIADHLFLVVGTIFRDSGAGGSTVLLGAFFHLIAIYTDFSGYSDIACGSSKLLGIRLTNNFAYPFFSTNISEFWSKWHRSLTSWMMDYVFTPMSFLLRRVRFGLYLSILTVFLLIGIWHGLHSSNIAFGLLQSLYFIPLLRVGMDRNGQAIDTPRGVTPIKLLNMCGLFLLMSVTSIFLYEPQAGRAIELISRILSPTLLSMPLPDSKPRFLFIVLVFFFAAEWFGRHAEYPLQPLSSRLGRLPRWAVYATILSMIALHGKTGDMQFMYFKF